MGSVLLIMVPEDISSRAKSFIYANEADVLNVALFGMTAKMWRDSHPAVKEIFVTRQLSNSL
jgi:hypothetical protein